MTSASVTVELGLISLTGGMPSLLNASENPNTKTLQFIFEKINVYANGKTAKFSPKQVQRNEWLSYHWHL